MQINHEKCAVLVTSCDKYEDAWFPFFKLLQIHWPDIPYALYLNTENKVFEIDGFSIKCLHPDVSLISERNLSWSSRLKQALLRIPNEYILFFLEDFFVKAIRPDMIEKCLKWMDEDKNIGYIDFYHEKYENDILVNEEFSETKKDFDWAINANCGLWRKSFLLNLLRDENPWDFEMNATARWRRTNFKVYTHRPEFPFVIDYLFSTVNGDWSGIMKGKWIPLAVDLLRSNGIVVNFDNLGVEEPPCLVGRIREKNWFWHDCIKLIKTPRLVGHYFLCTWNVAKDKLKRFWRNHLNW